MFLAKFSQKTIHIPEMQDLTMLTFLALDKAETDQQLLQCLIGDKANELPEGRVTQNILRLAQTLRGEVKQWLNAPEPVELKVLDKVIKLPESITALPYWPITKAKDIVRKMAKEPYNQFESYIELVGHYIYSTVTGKPYNEYEAEAFANEVVSQLDFRKVILMGDFFLFRHKSLWLPRRQRLTMALKVWKYRLVSMFSISTAN